MQIVELPTNQLREATWNPNQMDTAMLSRLRASINSFGLVVPLVVRSIGEGCYETIGGAQRLTVLRELGAETVPCVLVNADDGKARLLSQALNHIAGSDNLGERAELIRDLLATMPEADILSILPESVDSLKSMASLGQDTLTEYLQKYQQAQAARLKHLQFQLTSTQLKVVEEALSQIQPLVNKNETQNPNVRGNSLYLLCKWYLEKGNQDE